MAAVLLAFHPGALLSVLAFGALIAWVAWIWAKDSSDSPGVLLVKILISVILLSVAVWAMVRIHPVIGVPVGALCGIVVGILWGKNIGLALASPLTNLYDGGKEADAPKPFYAIAEAHRKQARYGEAIALVEEQLDRFPGDVQGLLMLAEIRCRHLKDWVGARVAVEQIVGNASLAVATRAKALQALADWHLELAQDSEAARGVLQDIIHLFPDTPESMEASQRLAHVGDGAWRREQREPTRLVVPKGDPRLGLRDDYRRGPAAPAEADPEEEANRLLAHLQSHPLDAEAREKLAILYAERMGRLDWGVAEVEKLLAEPHHPAKAQARWLHLLADLHVRGASDEASAREALQRIGRLFPGSALEAAAQSRLERLKIEIRGRRAGPVLGSGQGS